MLIDFSGTAGQVRNAFQTEIHHLEVHGERHVSNVSDPRIPAQLDQAYKRRERVQHVRSSDRVNWVQ